MECFWFFKLETQTVRSRGTPAPSVRGRQNARPGSNCHFHHALSEKITEWWNNNFGLQINNIAYNAYIYDLFEYPNHIDSISCIQNAFFLFESDSIGKKNPICVWKLHEGFPKARSQPLETFRAVFVFLIICRRSSSTRRLVVRRSRETFCNAAVTKNVDSTTLSVIDVEKVWYGLGEKFGDRWIVTFFCFRQKSLIMKTIDLKDYAED